MRLKPRTFIYFMLIMFAITVGMVGCDSDDDDSGPNPVTPATGTYSLRDFHADDHFVEGVAVYAAPEIFEVNVPAAGDYMLTCTTLQDSFQIVFRATEPALLTFELQPGDQVTDARLEQGTIVQPGSAAAQVRRVSENDYAFPTIWSSFGVILFAWPGGVGLGSPVDIFVVNVEYPTYHLIQASVIVVHILPAPSERYRTLTVEKSGTGSGWVTSDPGSIDCGTTCSNRFVKDASVTLTAHPAVDSAFTGWSDDNCSDNDTCTVTLNENTTITANFDFVPQIDTISVSPGISDNFGVYIGNGVIQANIPQAGIYLLTGTTNLGVFHMVFEVEANSLLYIGFTSGLTILDLTLEQGELTPLAMTSPEIQNFGYLTLFYKPGNIGTWGNYIIVNPTIVVIILVHDGVIIVDHLGTPSTKPTKPTGGTHKPTKPTGGTHKPTKRMDTAIGGN